MDLDILQLLAAQPMPSCVLTADDYKFAAWNLGSEVAAIQAVAGVETSGEPFDPEGRPTVLFERHVFHRLTGGKYDASHPEISNPIPGGYGPKSIQYARLAAAVELDAIAALSSASWGAFQVMGEFYAQAGFDSVVSLVCGMRLAYSAHLKAFVKFLCRNSELLKSLQAKDWTAFARAYNGPSYAINRYDARLAEEYSKAAHQATPATA